MISSLISNSRDSNLHILEDLSKNTLVEFKGFRDMTEQRSKMLIAGIVVIRVFIHAIIMRCKDSLKISAKAERLLNIGSFLYNVAMDLIRASAPVYTKNQDFLTVDLKMKPRSNLLKAFGKCLAFNL